MKNPQSPGLRGFFMSIVGFNPKTKDKAMGCKSAYPIRFKVHLGDKWPE